MKYESFDDWYLEVESFSVRAERIDLPKTHESMRKWLMAAFEAAREKK